MPDAATKFFSKMPDAHAKRLSWAQNAYGHFLAAAVRQDTSTKGQRRNEVASIKRNFAPFPPHLAP
jgi:hypothetical protein